MKTAQQSDLEPFSGNLSQSENISDIKLPLILVKMKNLYDFLKTKAERPSFYYDINKCNRVHVGLEFQVWASFIENKILQKLG